MFLTYKPEGSEEPQEFIFTPENTNTFDSEAIESATSWTWEEFLLNLRKGSTKARRVLLWICLRRVHRGLQLRDVAFKQREVTLEYDKVEMEALRQGVLESPDQPGIDKSLILAAMDSEIEKARSAPEDGGKALDATND